MRNRIAAIGLALAAALYAAAWTLTGPAQRPSDVPVSPAPADARRAAVD
ncbi:hypothetical protein [Prosthecomicrobium sp. N25]